MAKRKNRDGPLWRFNGTNPHTSLSPLLFSRLKFWLLRSISSALRRCVVAGPPLPPPPHAALGVRSLLPPLARRVRDTPTGAGDRQQGDSNLQPVHARPAWKASRATHCVIPHYEFPNDMFSDFLNQISGVTQSFYLDLQGACFERKIYLHRCQSDSLRVIHFVSTRARGCCGVCGRRATVGKQFSWYGQSNLYGQTRCFASMEHPTLLAGTPMAEHHMAAAHPID